MIRREFAPGDTNDVNGATWLLRMCDIRLNRIFRASWKITTGEGNSHDTLSCNLISDSPSLIQDGGAIERCGCSGSQRAFMSFNVVCSSQNIVDLPAIHKEFSPKHIYDRQSLLDIGNAYKYELSQVRNVNMCFAFGVHTPCSRTWTDPLFCFTTSYSAKQYNLLKCIMSVVITQLKFQTEKTSIKRLVIMLHLPQKTMCVCTYVFPQFSLDNKPWTCPKQN